ncbi:MAG TPA: RDD family protein [Usitatibacter sp.]|nr:RDD family protein [Usitatibacter sp.]
MSTLATTQVVPLYAGFWRRAAAAVLDGIILFIPNLILTFLVTGMLAFVIQIAIGILYYTILTASEAQATWGKRAFGIKVTSLEGQRIGFGRSLARYFATWLSGLILAIGFIMAGFTSRKQALHDMICGTLVVNREASVEEIEAGGDTMPVTAGVWVMVVVLFVLPFFGGILAAIAIPAYSDYTMRSKVAAALNVAGQLKQDVERAHAEKRQWAVGPATVDTTYVQSAEITAQGHVVVTLPANVANGGRIRYTPSDAGGTLQWKCAGEGVANKYLPASCRS